MQSQSQALGADSDLDTAIAKMAHWGRRHVTTSPATPEDVLHCEALLGRRLPPSFVTFLTRLGSGLFFDRHEFFGPHRLMIHDIELVPDLLTAKQQLIRLGMVLPSAALPFHRDGQVIHWFESKNDLDIGCSVPGIHFRTFSSFLNQTIFRDLA